MTNTLSLLNTVLTTATIFLFVILTISQGNVGHMAKNAFAQQEFEVYESEEFGFTLEHPSDWQVKEPSSYEIELVGHRPYIIRMELPSSLEDDIATRTNRPTVEIDMDTSDSNSLEQYVSERIDRSVSFTPNMNINTNETTLAGLPAITVVMTSPGGVGKGMDIYTMTNEGRIYNIHYAAHESKFDMYLPVTQRIIDTFAIIDRQGGE